MLSRQGRQTEGGEYLGRLGGTEDRGGQRKGESESQQSKRESGDGDGGKTAGVVGAKPPGKNREQRTRQTNGDRTQFCASDKQER